MVLFGVFYHCSFKFFLMKILQTISFFNLKQGFSTIFTDKRRALIFKFEKNAWLYNKHWKDSVEEIDLLVYDNWLKGWLKRGYNISAWEGKENVKFVTSFFSNLEYYIFNRHAVETNIILYKLLTILYNKTPSRNEFHSRLWCQWTYFTLRRWLLRLLSNIV